MFAIEAFLLNRLVSPPILSRQSPFIYVPEAVGSNMWSKSDTDAFFWHLIGQRFKKEAWEMSRWTYFEDTWREAIEPIQVVPVSPDDRQRKCVDLYKQMLYWPVDLVCVLCEERLCCPQTSSILWHPLESICVCDFPFLENCVFFKPNTHGFNHRDSRGREWWWTQPLTVAALCQAGVKPITMPSDNMRTPERRYGARAPALQLT